MRKTLQRTATGTLAILMPAGILLAIVAMGAFALDIAHNVTVRTELQSATDSGALAGARDLIKAETKNNAEQSALSVAATNSADGRMVSNTSAETQISALVDEDPSIGGGTVTVESEMTIENRFAKIFGHDKDVVRTRSVAIAYGAITRIRDNMLFPLAVSATTTNGNIQPIMKAKIGDTVFIEINSQQWKNGAFTSFTIANPNADWLKNVVDMSLGLIPAVPGAVPAMQVGDNLNFTNGVASQKDLAKGSLVEQLTDSDRTLILPVMQGDPPYNQARKCIGFITVKVKRVNINGSGGQVQSLECELVKGVTKGRGGNPNESNDNNLNNWIHRVSPGTVQLIS